MGRSGTPSRTTPCWAGDLLDSPTEEEGAPDERTIVKFMRSGETCSRSVAQLRNHPPAPARRFAGSAFLLAVGVLAEDGENLEAEGRDAKNRQATEARWVLHETASDDRREA